MSKLEVKKTEGKENKNKKQKQKTKTKKERTSAFETTRLDDDGASSRVEHTRDVLMSIYDLSRKGSR